MFSFNSHSPKLTPSIDYASRVSWNKASIFTESEETNKLIKMVTDKLGEQVGRRAGVRLKMTELDGFSRLRLLATRQVQVSQKASPVLRGKPSMHVVRIEGATWSAFGFMRVISLGTTTACSTVSKSIIRTIIPLGSH